VGAITPDVVNFDLSTVSGFSSSAAGCVADAFHHPNHVAGVTPWLTIRHGGALAAGDHYAPWVLGGTMNLFIEFLMASATTAFSVCSLGTPQFTNAGPTTGVGHLPAIVNSSTGATLLTTPSTISRYEAALAAAIDHFDMLKVIESGASAGMQLVGLAGMNTARPSQVKGILGYYPIPEVRKVLSGGDTLHWSVITGLYGTATQAAWDAISLANKRLGSINYFLEQSTIPTILPWYIVLDRVGNHIKPYGDPAKPNSAPHDIAQFEPLISLLRAHGISVTVSVFPIRFGWELLPLESAAVSALVETWMAARVA